MFQAPPLAASVFVKQTLQVIQKNFKSYRPQMIKSALPSLSVRTLINFNAELKPLPFMAQLTKAKRLREWERPFSHQAFVNFNQVNFAKLVTSM